MAQALTANETTILKSRFGAGADGNRQQIKLTKKQYAATTLTAIRNIRSWVHPTSGMPALLMKGVTSIANGSDGLEHIWFIPYLTQSLTGPGVRVDTELVIAQGGAADDESLGLVYFGSKWWAWYVDGTAQRHRYKTSGDGVTWSAAATPGPIDFTPWTYKFFDVYVPQANDAIYVFTTATGPSTGSGLQPVWYTKSTDGVTWSALANTGFTAGQGFGYQQSTYTRFTKTASNWHALRMEGGVVSNSVMHQRVASLGGTWSTAVQALYTGNLAGGREGFYGFDLSTRNDNMTIDAVYQDIGADLAIDNSLNRRTSVDEGVTWTPTDTGGTQESGGGSDVRHPDVYHVATFNGGAGELDAWGNDAGVIRVTKLATATRNDETVFGAGQSTNPVVDVTVDISDRVISIGWDKALDMDADGLSVELHNADRALDIHGSGSLSAYMRPNVKIEVWQWHGVVANKVQTFTAAIDAVSENANRQTSTLSGRTTGAKQMMRIIVKTTAPQVLSETGYVRDMGNYVYLNKTLAEVLTDLLDKGQIAVAKRSISTASTFVFRELTFQDGISLWDAAKQACELAGFVCYFNELDVFTAESKTVTRSSSWTFTAKEDLVDLGTDYDDEDTYTRVRLIGRANLGAKYLKEQFVWPSPATGPRAIAYDPTTAHVWVITTDNRLYRLNPASNMAIVAGYPVDLSAWLSGADSIDVDGADNHLWISAGTQHRKVDRAAPGTTLLGPFNNPDTGNVRLHEYLDGATRRLYMTTYATGKLVRMNKDGTENSRVNSPVTSPMGITSDGQGGYLLTGFDQADMFQIDYAGNIVNRIQQPAKNSNELGYDSADLGVYAVFVDNSTIVKYAVTGTPTNVETATLAEVTNTALEHEMVGGRTLEIVDLNVTTLAEAHSVAQAKLREVARYRKRLTVGVVGQAGTQKGDVVTLDAPGSALTGTWRVRTVRSDQTADAGTWLAVLTVEPYSYS